MGNFSVFMTLTRATGVVLAVLGIAILAVNYIK